MINLPKDITIEEVLIIKDDLSSYKELNKDNHEEIHFTSLDGEKNYNYEYVNKAHRFQDDSIEPTCLDKGLNHVYCLDCGYVHVNDPVNPLGHTGEDIYYDDEVHYYKCDRCGEFYGETAHEFTVEHNTKYHYNYCEICEAKVGITEHVYDEETHYCSCGVFDLSHCPHEHTHIVKGTNPTCTKNGTTDQVYCDDCKRKVSGGEVIPASHTYEDGECIICHEFCHHNDSSYSEIVNPSCTKEGLEPSLICDECGMILEEGDTIPKTAHNYVDGKCVDCGEIMPTNSNKKSCKRASVLFISTIISLTSVIGLCLKRYNK